VMGAHRVAAAAVIAWLCLLAAACAPPPHGVKRVGSVIGIQPENIADYKRLHAAVWPEILEKLREVHIRNYSIYLAEVEEGKFYLFSTFEYAGDDFEADMKKMAADPNTQRWWKHTDPLQAPVPTRKEGEWWHTIEEVFHMD